MRVLLKFFIIVYRKAVTPFLLPRCKFLPTCSEYALQALNKYGTFKGSWLALKRVLKCHPFSAGGYDPLL